MNYVYFILAIFFLVTAHYIKIIRQSQFIEIYEKPPKNILSKALAITFILNLILPFKLGNIFRVIYPGKHLKNGKSFSLATIIIDILIDFFTVTLLYIIFFILGKNVYNNFVSYVLISIVIIIICIIMLYCKKRIKRIVLNLSSIFNERIRLAILKVTWYTITAFEDMFKRINKKKLLLSTTLSFICYLLSYYFLTIFLNNINIKIGFTNICEMLYGSYNIFQPTIYVFYRYVGINALIYLFIYILVPILIIYISSKFYRKPLTKGKNKTYIELFPHINPQDRLNFLYEYFNAEKSAYLNDYLNINRDVSIIQDYSAGSNATTMLCRKDDNLFYRKYSIGKDSQKLYNQVEWINCHKKHLELTDISDVYFKDEICYYDMPYIENALTCFSYVHTMPFENSWKILKKVLNDLDINLHSINRRKSDFHLMELYIETKVLNNIKKIEESSYLKSIIKYDYIYINGKKYHNLKYFQEKYLNKQHLIHVFQNDEYSDIHGDFTIENIVCLKNDKNKSNKYYIIDPNTGNVHDSPYLDYAKLLQSIHGGYEFLVNTKNVQCYDNQINFLFTKSNVYYNLFENVVIYLEKKFGQEGLKSIFYHEVIHWLRLLPYKINKLEERSVLFYAGFIMVMSDVEKRFEK